MGKGTAGKRGSFRNADAALMRENVAKPLEEDDKVLSL